MTAAVLTDAFSVADAILADPEFVSLLKAVLGDRRRVPPEGYLSLTLAERCWFRGHLEKDATRDSHERKRLIRERIASEEARTQLGHRAESENLHISGSQRTCASSHLFRSHVKI